MSKPWDNEPTPIATRASESASTVDAGMVVDLDTASDLERRMRAAERLVAEIIAGYEAERGSDFDWIEWYEKAKAHLEAT